ncbi:MAG TPA: cytochrome c peroxidase [Azospirillaceae bacterium]|nr:cytochrome c peroxidase [Azospirillaceae bacterium]
MLRPAVAALAAAAVLTLCGPAAAQPWTEAERALIASLSLDRLGPPPPDPSNRVADDPRAAGLGRALFFDAGLSGGGAVSCATCHQPEKGFQDGLPLGRGAGTTDRRTIPVEGAGRMPWLFWDGRADSLWAQALGPLESAAEHAGTRTRYAHHVAASHRDGYEALFGPLPDLAHLPRDAGPLGTEAERRAWEAMAPADRAAVDRVFANVGKALAAFQRRLDPRPGRFDRYAAALSAGRPAAGILTAEEEAGLRLFVGRGQCVNCHNGPLLSDGHFHNTGVPAAPGLPEDRGRAAGIGRALADPFNCLGPHSDARPEDCAELAFAVTEGEELVRAFKPPTLRGVAARAPYMHAGQVPTLAAVLDHYNRAPAAPAGHSELVPLGLDAAALRQLEAFLGTLTPEPAPEPAPGPDRPQTAESPPGPPAGSVLPGMPQERAAKSLGQVP